jgi:hypothetical protein
VCVGVCVCACVCVCCVVWGCFSSKPLTLLPTLRTCRSKAAMFSSSSCVCLGFCRHKTRQRNKHFVILFSVCDGRLSAVPVVVLML